MLDLNTFLKAYFLVGLAVLALCMAVQTGKDWAEFKRRASNCHLMVSVFALMAALILWEVFWPIPVTWAVTKAFRGRA